MPELCANPLRKPPGIAQAIEGKGQKAIRLPNGRIREAILHEHQRQLMAGSGGELPRIVMEALQRRGVATTEGQVALVIGRELDAVTRSLASLKLGVERALWDSRQQRRAAWAEWEVA